MNIIEQIQSFLSYSVLNINFGRLLAALAIFLFVYTLRHVVLKICIGSFRKLASRTKTSFDDQLLEAIEPPARFFLAAFGLWAALEFMRIPEEANTLAVHVVRSLFVFSIFWAAFRATTVLSGILQELANRTQTSTDDQLVHFVGKFLRIAVVLIGTMVIVREWGYDITGLLAGLGLGGLAIALAARETVSNVFGSITILLDRPFATGDWIESPAVEGVVEDIHLRSTRVRTFANALVTVPNSVLANDAITNWSRMKKRRITYKLGVTYSTKSDQMETCVSDIKIMLESHKDIHSDMIFVYFTDFGNSALEIFLYFFTTTTQWQEYLNVRQDVNLRIMKIIESNGLSIAFPSRSIYLESTNKSSQEHWDKIAAQNNRSEPQQ